MESRELIFVGTFWDQPSRILSYTTAARAMGASTRFISSITDIDYRSLDARQFVFTDEDAITSSHHTVKSNADHDALHKKLCALIILTDKYCSRKITQSGFEHEHFLISSMDEIDKLPALSGRWICKPRLGSNARDVREVTGHQSLHTAASEILSRGSDALLERYIDGDHLCIEFAWDGSNLFVTGFCKKLMTDFEPKIIEAYHTLDPDIIQHADNAAKALFPIFKREFGGFRFSIHGEFIVEHETGDIKIAELNARAPWGLLPELLSTGNGIDYDANVIRNALGLPVSKPSGLYPAVLGSVYSEEFFVELQDAQDYGNTIFVEPLQVPSDDETYGKLVKYGRFLLWGLSVDAVRKQWVQLGQLALPDVIRHANQIDASDTWKSRCC